MFNSFTFHNVLIIFDSNLSRLTYLLLNDNMSKHKRIYSKEILEPIIGSCVNYADVCRKVGIPVKGGSYELIRGRIKEYNLDISHFLCGRTFAGKRNPNYNNRKTKEDILT